MKKIIINNVEFCDFGANNYSNGMHLISCYPMPKNIVEDVLMCIKVGDKIKFVDERHVTVNGVKYKLIPVIDPIIKRPVFKLVKDH